MQNAVIGPTSTIEIRAGSSYEIKAMYPVPDGPLYPLKANVVWSIEPAVKGISINAKSGKISVDADVPHGSIATVHGNVENGRRKLVAKIYVFHPNENPLVGAWQVDIHVVCGATEKLKVVSYSPHALYGNTWKFHADQQFWVGKEYNIAAGVRLAGRYELDVKTANIKLVSSWPGYRHQRGTMF